MRLRAFLQSVPLPVIGLDRERRVTVWNEAAERLLGWTAEEVLGKPDPSVPPEVTAEQKTIVDATFRGEEALQRQSERVTRGGAVVDVEITTTFIPKTTREDAIALLLLHDVTEHLAEHGLAARETQLELILEQLPAIISTFDANGALVSARGAGLRGLKADARDFAGRHYTDILGEEHPFARSMTAALHGESTSYEQLYEDRIFMNRAEPLRDLDQRIIGVINLAFDITEHRRTEEALRESREQLRRLTAAMNRMQEDERRRVAREMQGEVGQLLASVKRELGAMRRDVRRNVSPAAVEERIGTMVDLLDGTMRTVRRLATELRPAMLDDRGLRAAVEQEVASFEQRTGIDVNLSICRDDLIDADHATAIYRIIQEALTNVARHAGATHVDLRVEARGGQVETELRDNGRGITQLEINSTSTLGLLGVRERAYALGGEAIIEPIPGDGTRVFVSLPQ